MFGSVAQDLGVMFCDAMCFLFELSGEIGCRRGGVMVRCTEAYF